MAKRRRVSATAAELDGTADHVARRLPVELWTELASWCTRSAVYRLCLSSKTFYFLFNPVLYKSLLTEHDSVCPALLRTLSSRRGRASLGPHPASLVRDLFLNTIHLTSTRPIETTLKNTSLVGDRSLGSRLRALTWDIREVPPNVAQLLQDPDAFPCLKEISLRFAWRMFNAPPKSNMRIFLNPGLEKLTIEYKVCNGRGYDWSPLMHAITDLPHACKLLHSLRLSFKSDVYSPTLDSTRLCCPGSFEQLLATIYALRLPLLQSLDLHVSHGPLPGAYPTADPSPFIKAHPTLQRLQLCMETKLADDLALALPHLRSFCGYERLCRNFLGPQSTLQELTVLRDDLGIATTPDLLFAPTPSLRNVHVFPRVKKMKQHLQKGLSPKDLEALATSFPDLTSLDIPILPPLPKYARELALFGRLRALTLRIHCANLLKVDPCVYCGECHMREHVDNRQVQEIYPAHLLMDEMEADLVLAMHDLTTLTARVTSDGILAVQSIDENEIAERDVEDSKVVYEFSVNTDGAGEKQIVLERVNNE
ncbi:hypothetical protein BD626DRAFT_266042 [Schizophyllum amplum]|uniref:Uncharacterized protein n=1 Tax=Schizophyllum amplum TaxID=97359 RepID=A0A550CH66_9AGAR|nr:hypothetical protein BD626DRAFT_266042 [Auriculariopsis ampla]